ncbi:hypothetical protein GCM10018962_77070 [Dactylosporangium matsuzakiense]|uniref:hypothetical protein n=1 Tax=Dactylosporangium matsuzakiense TaxID=53360 RepID=UPI0031EF56FC
MSLKLGELVAEITADDSGLKINLSKAKEEVRAAGKAMEKDADQSGRKVGNNLGKWAPKALASAAAAGALGSGLALVAANAIAVAAAVAPAVSTVALLPGGFLAAAAAVSVFRLAFGGLGAAMKATSAGGASSAGSLLAAERRLTQAQRGALQAQEDLNRARADAAKRVRDLAVELSGAALDEEDAKAAVARARAELAAAPVTGDPNAAGEAERNLRQAEQRLTEIKNRVSDLKDEKAESDKNGVEGSQQVRDALQRQADAVQEVADAQAALRNGGGGGGGGPDPMAQLSPAGRELISTLRALTPQWQAFRRAVQQATLKNLSGEVRGLSDRYLPVLTNRLTALGSAFNLSIRQASGLVRSREYVADVDTALGNASTAAGTLSRVLTPVVNILRQVGVVGSGFLPGMADEALRLAERFERWITAARQSGQLQQWISSGLEALKNLGVIAWNVGGAIVAIFRAGGSSDGQSFLQWLADATGRLSAFLNSAEGQNKIAGVLGTLRDLSKQVAAGLEDMKAAKVDETFSASAVILGFFADHLGVVARYLPEIIAAFVIYKSTQAAANAAAVAMVPIEAARVASQFGLVSAMTAHTAALTANTAAAAASVPATAASGTAAAGASTGFWALAAALLANPITWIVLAIVALIAIIVLLATKTRFFQTVWEYVWGFMKAVGAWFAGPFADFFVRGFHWVMNALESWWARVKAVPGQLREAFAKVTDFITLPFRLAFNAVSRLWNGTVGQLSWSVPSWVPGIGGRTLSVPHLPQLAEGGVVPQTAGGRLVVAGEGREAEAVLPLSKLAGMLAAARGTGGHAEQTIHVSLELDGEVIAEKTLTVIRSNPDQVASAARAGEKSLTFGN